MKIIDSVKVLNQRTFEPNARLHIEIPVSDIANKTAEEFGLELGEIVRDVTHSPEFNFKRKV